MSNKVEIGKVEKTCIANYNQIRNKIATKGACFVGDCFKCDYYKKTKI